MPQYAKLKPPTNGQTVAVRNGKLNVPDNPIIPFIEGDGTGSDIWKASQRVFDAAVKKAYGDKRTIVWFEVFAGEKPIRCMAPIRGCTTTRWWRLKNT
jgi:isocitrate dehydrogenase